MLNKVVKTCYSPSGIGAFSSGDKLEAYSLSMSI